MYRHDGQSVSVDVPVMQVQAYSAEEIYEKELYFLVPFYAMRFEREFDRTYIIDSIAYFSGVWHNCWNKD